MNDIIIFIVGIISGIIGTTMGGSMLIIIPFLISLGLSPYHAIATANLAIKKGDKLLKKLFLLITIIMIIVMGIKIL